MITNNLKFDKSVVTNNDEVTHCITISSEVVIKRDNKFHNIPFTQIFEFPDKTYCTEDLEIAILSYLFHANKISKKWIIMKENIVDLDGGRGRVLTQKDFDIVNDI